MRELLTSGRFPHRTVAGKNTLLMMLCGLGMLLFVMFLPPLFYSLTKSDLTDRISGSIRESSVRLGFLLTGHRTAGQFARSIDTWQLLASYYEEGSDKEEIREEMEKKLTTYE